MFTKCSRVWNAQREISGSLKADSVRRECEASLRRLKVETIDLYQIHWPEPDADIEEAWTTLEKLREEGKVRWIGVSNFNAAQMERCRRDRADRVAATAVFGDFAGNGDVKYCPIASGNDIGVIVYSPMKSGLLTGKMTRERVANFAPDDFRRNALAFREPHLGRNLELAELMKRIGARHGRSAGEVAIAWTLRNPAVTGAIVGMRSAAQAREVLGALEFRLGAEEIAEIDAFPR